MEPSFQNGVYYTPGKRVLYYLSISRILLVIIIFIFLMVGFSFLKSFINSAQFINIGFFILFVLAVIFCLVIFLLASIQYRSVKFMFDEFALHIQRGILSKTEIAIPFRQIQNINHSQSFNEKMVGIMHVVIETAGTNESESNARSGGILPILDTKLALALEQELLKRSSDIRPNQT